MGVFPYPGAKWRHAEWILEHAPAHRVYIEPCAGAAGVLFEKPESAIEVYNDLDGELVRFFKLLRDDTDALADALGRIPYARSEYERVTEWLYRDADPPGDDVQRAAEWLFMRWAQFGGKYDGTSGFAVDTSRARAKTFRAGVAKLTRYAERLEGVHIENVDCVECIERHGDGDSFIYVDPPYLTEHGSGYLVGDGEGFDFAALRDALDSSGARWMVSLSELPAAFADPEARGYHLAEKGSTFAIHGNGKETTERLVMNYDPDSVVPFNGMDQPSLGELLGD